MVESTVILRARICAADLATLAAGVWAFTNVGPNAGTKSTATVKIEIKQQKRFLIAHLVNWRVQQYAEASAIILKHYSFGEKNVFAGMTRSESWFYSLMWKGRVIPSST
jgi:hypothetical protein